MTEYEKLGESDDDSLVFAEEIPKESLRKEKTLSCLKVKDLPLGIAGKPWW